MKLFLLACVFLLLSSAVVAVSYTQSATEIKLIYLTNSSGGIVNYPKVGYAYRCNALVFPRDNFSLTSVTFVEITIPGASNVSNEAGTQSLDLQSWNSSLFTAASSGTIGCNVTAYGTDGIYSIKNRTFSVTDAVPGCADYDVCTVSSPQSYTPGSSRTSRYLNLTVASGQTLTGPGNGSSLNLYADNLFTLEGTIQQIGPDGISTSNCIGSPSGALNMYARDITISGTAITQGGAGVPACTVGVCRGGNSPATSLASPALSITAITMNLSGNLKSIAGASGSFAASASYQHDVGASAGSISLSISKHFLMKSGTIETTASKAPAVAAGTLECMYNVTDAADAGGDSRGLILIGGKFVFSGGNVTSTAGGGEDGPSNLARVNNGKCGGTGGEATLVSSADVNELTVNGTVFLSQSGPGGQYCGRFVNTHGGDGNSGDGGNAQGAAYTMNNLTNVTSTLTLTPGAAGPNTGARTSCTVGSDSANPASAGVAGTHTIHYAYADPANDFTKFLPSRTTTADASHKAGPNESFTFTSPIDSDVYIAGENVSVNWTPSNTTFHAEIYWSTDNTTWIPINGTEFILYNDPDSTHPWNYTGEAVNTSNRSFSIYLQDRPIYLKGAFQYNGIYTPEVYLTFNASAIPTNITSSQYPAGENVTASSLAVSCNYSRPDKNPVYNAPVYVNIDGSNFSAGFNVATQNYSYTNSTPVQGAHNWTCLGQRQNYKSAAGNTSNYTYGSYLVDFPPGVTTVRMFCPFPTFVGVTPWGQTAGVGIFKISNLNATSTINVSVTLNQTIANVYVYARPNWSGISNIYSWTPSSTLLGTSPQTIQFNVNHTTPKYIWSHANCNDTAVQNVNVSYSVTVTG